MNAKRSTTSFDRLGRGGVSANAKNSGRVATIANILPRVYRAGLAFALLTGPGMLPGVYAQTDAPLPIQGGPVKRSKTLKQPRKPSKPSRTPTPPAATPGGGKIVGGGTPVAPIATPIAGPPVVVRRAVPAQGHGVTPIEVAQYRAQMQNAPFAKADPSAMLNALIQRGRMPVTAVSGSSSGSGGSGGGSSIIRRAAAIRTNIGNSTGVWFPMGPYQRLPGGDRDQGILPVAGRVNGIGYANDKTGIFYLATASGGVWKWDPGNADGLNSQNQTVDSFWTHFSDTQFPTPETSSVAVDPNDHRIVYVGAGDYDGSGFAGNLEHAGPNYGIGYGLGIMKSVNGGATWYNIANGNPLTTAPGLTGKAGSATPIMEGTAVSAIVINPTNSKNIIATSGRGVNPGGIWYSADSGNTWTRASIGTTAIAGGNWSSLSVSNLDGTAANLRYYASREDDGVYSSPDGVTWTKLPVPLIYNGANNGEGNVGIKVVASVLPRQNNLTAIQRVVYVVDASQSKNDGRIFKSIDGGATWSDITGTYPANQGNDNTFSDATFALNANSSLVPVVGNSSAGSTLRTLLVDLLSIGTRLLATSTSPIEPTGAGGPKYLGNLTGTQASQVADPGASPDFVIPDNFFYPDPLNAVENIPHRIEHGSAVSPASLIAYLNGNQTFLEGMLLSDGGVYPTQIQNGFYGLDSTLSYLYYQAPDVQIVNPEPLNQDGSIAVDSNGKPPFPTMNDNLVITQMLNGDFFEVGNSVLVRGATVDTMIAETDDALTPLPKMYPATYQPDWISIQNLLNPFGDPNPAYSLASYESKQTVEVGNDQGVNSYTASNDGSIYGTNPEAVSSGASPSIDQRGFPTMDTISFSPLDLSGATQIMATSAGSGQWLFGAKRLYYTNSNWAPNPTSTTVKTGSLDITADQQQYIGRGGSLIYIYNTTSPQDGTVGPTWQGEYHTQLGMPFAWDYAPDVTQDLPQFVGTNTAFVDTAAVTTQETGTETSQALYVGDGSYLWRFDPPGSLAYPPQPAPQPAQPLLPAPAHKVYWPWTVGPNDDHGIWRQMNTTQLAGNTADDHISAIGVVPGTGTVYVGTTTGTLWVTTDDNGRRGSDYQSSVFNTNVGDVAVLTSAQTLPKLLPTWYKIAGPGTTSNLPNRPITSINVNFDPNTTSHSYGDILVTLGGAGGAGPNGVVGRVWRASNAIGALPGVPTFTNASGTTSNQTYAFLPDVTVYQIARDLDDPSNTYYAATDVGVFSSIDSGSTWTNATAPLGLPNVACTAVKVVRNSTTLAKTLGVTTFGRGAWGFDLTNITPVITKPNLIYSTTFNRTGNTIVVNLKITDFSTAAAPAGTAFNVTLNSASLLNQGGISLGSAFTSLSNPATSVVQATPSASGAPISIGTIGQNQTVYVTLYFDATSIRTGTLADLQLSGSYTLPPIPPGTTTTFSNKGSLVHVP